MCDIGPANNEIISLDVLKWRREMCINTVAGGATDRFPAETEMSLTVPAAHQDYYCATDREVVDRVKEAKGRRCRLDSN
jgi:hypothetical protein